MRAEHGADLTMIVDRNTRLKPDGGCRRTRGSRSGARHGSVAEHVVNGRGRAHRSTPRARPVPGARAGPAQLHLHDHRKPGAVRAGQHDHGVGAQLGRHARPPEPAANPGSCAHHGHIIATANDSPGIAAIATPGGGGNSRRGSLALFPELAASFRVGICHRDHALVANRALGHSARELSLLGMIRAAILDELTLGCTGQSPVRHAHESSPGQMMARACHRHGSCFPLAHRLCEILLHRPTCEQA